MRNSRCINILRSLIISSVRSFTREINEAPYKKFALPRAIFSLSLCFSFCSKCRVVKKFPTQLLRVRKPTRSGCRYFPHVVSRLMDPPWRRVSHGPWSKRFVFVFRSRWLRVSVTKPDAHREITISRWIERATNIIEGKSLGIIRDYSWPIPFGFFAGANFRERERERETDVEIVNIFWKSFKRSLDFYQ